MREADRLIIAALEPIRQGDEFPQLLPLHVTVYPWFVAPTMEHSFYNGFANFMRSQHPIQIVGGEEAMYGINNDIPVRTVERPGKLELLHHRIGELIVRFGGVVTGPWSGDNYSPHVTDRNDRSLDAGQTVMLQALQYIRRTPEGVRVVERVFPFQAHRTYGAQR